jgi:hypothetical protein
MSTRSVSVLAPMPSRREESAPADVLFAITSLSKQLLEINKELTSFKEIMVAIALCKSARPWI